MNLADRIQSLRKAKGISQEELASYAWKGELEESTAMLNLGENSMSVFSSWSITAVSSIL